MIHAPHLFGTRQPTRLQQENLARQSSKAAGDRRESYSAFNPPVSSPMASQDARMTIPAFGRSGGNVQDARFRGAGVQGGLGDGSGGMGNGGLSGMGNGGMTSMGGSGLGGMANGGMGSTGNGRVGDGTGR